MHLTDVLTQHPEAGEHQESARRGEDSGVNHCIRILHPQPQDSVRMQFCMLRCTVVSKSACCFVWLLVRPSLTGGTHILQAHNLRKCNGTGALCSELVRIEALSTHMPTHARLGQRVLCKHLFKGLQGGCCCAHHLVSCTEGIEGF
jgi:hypothetical protein